MNADAADGDAEPPLKRMRRGTKSCLSCRRRKAKCTYTSPSETTCKQCVKHGFKCVPQGQIIDSSTTTKRIALKDRVEQLQLLVEQLIPKHIDVGEGGRGREETPDYEHESYAEVAAEITDLGEPLPKSNAAPLIRLLRDSSLGTLNAAPGDIPKPHDHDSMQHYPGGRHQSVQQLPKTAVSKDTVETFFAALPPPKVMDELFDNHSSWWPLWRASFDLIWGDSTSRTLRDFSVYAMSEKDPCLLGTLLIAFATCTGDLRRFLPPVETWIVYDDHLAGTERGLTCLIALGLCYLHAMQPERAWLTYHRANALLQLHSIHTTHRKSRRLDSIFWQLWHADRWVSMMTGLPYVLQDHFCDLTIPPMGEIDAATWLHRHLAVVSGRVVDSLQSFSGPSLSGALKVEEQLNRILAELPRNYLELTHIHAIQDPGEKITRLYRAVHAHQLRTYAHLPLMLRSAEENKYRTSLEICVNYSRQVLGAYLAIYDFQSSAASDGTVLNFTAFMAAVILLLGVLGYGRRGSGQSFALSQKPEMWTILSRTLEAIKKGSQGPAGILCRQCSTALESIIAISRTPPEDSEATRVVLPYFGTITLTRQSHQEVSAPQNPPAMEIPDTAVATRLHDSSANGMLNHGVDHLQLDGLYDDFEINYQGPYMTDVDAPTTMFPLDRANAFANLDNIGCWDVESDRAWPNWPTYEMQEAPP